MQPLQDLALGQGSLRVGTVTEPVEIKLRIGMSRECVSGGSPKRTLCTSVVCSGPVG